jgi:hypothetical protein
MRRIYKDEDAPALQSIIDTYLYEREGQDLPPTQEGLAIALDISVDTLERYAVDERYPRIADSCARARQHIMQGQIDWIMAEPRQRARFGEFLLKAWDRDRYGDKQSITQERELVVHSSVELGGMDADSVQAGDSVQPGKLRKVQ